MNNLHAAFFFSSFFIFGDFNDLSIGGKKHLLISGTYVIFIVIHLSHFTRKKGKKFFL
jgi:hypothetical protein